MAFNKKVFAAAAAGALTVATAVPALALENEFHGMFRVRGIISNWDGEGTVAAADEARVRRYVEQRARLLYNAKVSDDLKLVTHFEIDSRWGDDSYNVGRNDGGALGADQVNLETKNVYLDFNIPGVPVNGKVGIQPLMDSLKGVWVNADAAGAVFTSKFGQATAAVGYFRFDDNYNVDGTTNVGKSGKDVRDVYVVDGKYNVSQNVKVGGAWYGHFSDNQFFQDQRYNVVSVNGEAKFGPATVDGFVAYQFGNVADRNLSAWAANVGGKIKAGPGTAKAQFLFTSGDDGEGNNTNWQSITSLNATNGSASENSFYPSAMRILMRDATATAGTDRAVVGTSSNRGAGIIAGFVGYDANVTEKVFANANAGFMSTAREGEKSYIGTEVNAEVGYKISPNLTASVTGAYVFLEDQGRGGLPAATADAREGHQDPWTTRMMLSFTF